MCIKVLPYQLKKQIDGIKKECFYPALKSINGNILEIGFGKGENLKYYSNDCNVYAIEKKDKLVTSKKNKILGKDNLIIKKGSAEHLPFKNAFFDVVILSFVLCSVNSVENSIREIKRVLKRGGEIVLLEHIKSNNKITYKVQKVLNGVQTLFFDCHLDRDPREILRKNKFKILTEKIFYNSLEPYLFMELIKQ